MPEVIFTPRVSVRRMCTPSNMPFASSVRRISCDDRLARRDLRERERLRRIHQPVEVLLEAEDAAAVEPQPFPDRVAALHRPSRTG